MYIYIDTNNRYNNNNNSHLLGYRIAGDTAKDLDIYQSVCEQMERNFAKSKWKVSESLMHIICDIHSGIQITCG